ncbi:hypothetical protein TIFTF001_002797 [Ficus carica]|uniref:Uncharacterized protein n=1 Tax=Ficus carica TaxID=3494 RepID=A0AA87ZEX2_FICCA|nr:hypothetical protein TIFTF001_002797 [Ficus carica]
MESFLRTVNPPSILTEDNLDLIRGKYEFPNEVQLRLPFPNERADTVSEGMHHYQLAIPQLMLNGMRVFLGLIVIVDETGIELTTQVLVVSTFICRSLLGCSLAWIEAALEPHGLLREGSLCSHYDQLASQGLVLRTDAFHLHLLGIMLLVVPPAIHGYPTRLLCEFLMYDGQGPHNRRQTIDVKNLRSNFNQD